MSDNSTPDLKQTPLHALHLRLGARMAAFAGYDMPIQYSEGVMAEHNWTREHAGLFDVSHMGPCFLVLQEGLSSGDRAHDMLSAMVEKCVPSAIAPLAPGKMQLSVLLNEEGGILDDLMICRPAWETRQGMLYIVSNAATKEQDFELLQTAAGNDAEVRRVDDRGLLALQGPEAEAVLANMVPGVVDLAFMTADQFTTDNFGTLIVARCGYTGEDGFEILVEAQFAEAFAEQLLSDDRVKPVGLGARDSLRLEAGLCLYGHDIDASTSPVEGSLLWLIAKSRRVSGNFPGAAVILDQLANGVTRKRVGIRPIGRAPAREGTEIQTPDGETIGTITSGGFGPTIGGPVAMGYVKSGHTKAGTSVKLIVRGKELDAEVAALPFVPHNYKR